MAGLQDYKCPCCGGIIEFNSDIQKMKCPYCDAEFEMEALKNLDADLKNEAAPDDMTWESNAGGEWAEGETDGMRVYVCNSCGGEIVADETLSATHCPYCGNPVVMKDNFTGDLRPDYVIPFKLDKKAAKEGLKKHLSGKRFIPKEFKDENHIDDVKGVYVPCWLFDADANANITYNATRVRTWSDSNYYYTETSFYKIMRAGDIGFVRIPVDGSSKMPDDLMESIEPYDFKDAVDFQTAYLSGYLADKYDVTSKESIDRANTRIRRSTEDVFRSTVQGYTSVATASNRITLKNSKAKYALYPVWMLSTTWNGDKYIFAMNGQTGKFVGDLPLDKKAWLKWSLILTAIFAVAIFCIAVLMG